MMIGNGKSKKQKQIYRLPRIKKLCLMSIALPLLFQNIALLSKTAMADSLTKQSNVLIALGGDTPEPKTDASDAASETTAGQQASNQQAAKQTVADAPANAGVTSGDQAVNSAINKLNALRSNGPIEWVRSLQVLQDDIATGQAGSMQLQPVLLNEIGQKILAANAATWDNAENVYALMIYLFNGGNPNVVESVFKLVPEGVVTKEMRKGALAYARNRQTAFLQAFPEIPNADSGIPIALRVSIALGTANGILEKDAQEAMKRLDFVRIAAPGSLFEEAALRRQVKVAIAANRVDKLALLARNYVNRFSKSPYANEFWRDFSVQVPKVEYHLSDDELQSLVAISPNIVQFIIHMQVSRGALLDARMQRAHFSAEKSLQLAKLLKIDDSAAKLYYAGSFVGTTAAQKAADVLQTISIEKLPKRDQPLLAAAKSIASDVVYNNKNWPFPVDDESQNDDPMAALAQLPVEVKPEIVVEQNPPLPQNLTASNVVSTNIQAAQFADEIDQFMKITKEKIEDVDKMLESKQ